MANRYFNQFSGSLEKARVKLFAMATIGGAGGASMVTAKSKGITSITRTNTGEYTVVLQDNYVRLLDYDVKFASSTGIPAATCTGLKTANQTGFSTGSNTIVFVCSTAGGGAATDPGNNEIMFISLTLSNSSAI